MTEREYFDDEQNVSIIVVCEDGLFEAFAYDKHGAEVLCENATMWERIAEEEEREEARRLYEMRQDALVDRADAVRKYGDNA